MSNTEKFVELIKKYAGLKKIDCPTDLVKTLSETSKDDNKGNALYAYDHKRHCLGIIDLDVFQKAIYYNVVSKNLKADMASSVDAFVINSSNTWFLIEFKNSEYKENKGETRFNLQKKAYSSILFLTDLLYELKKNKIEQLGFDYNNPVDFFRKNVIYIIVFSDDKNKFLADKCIDNKRTSKKCYGYNPPFLKQLKGNFLKDTLAYTAEYFEKEFVKPFQY